MESRASGVRNSVGFDWHPQTKELWFTNHARDWVERRLAERHAAPRARKKGMNFGYPFCHQGDLLDPEFGKGRCVRASSTRPRAKLGAHIAPLGMRFYTGKMFPAEYQQQHLHRHARLVEPHAPSRATT